MTSTIRLHAGSNTTRFPTHFVPADQKRAFAKAENLSASRVELELPLDAKNNDRKSAISTLARLCAARVNNLGIRPCDARAPLFFPQSSLPLLLEEHVAGRFNMPHNLITICSCVAELSMGISYPN